MKILKKNKIKFSILAIAAVIVLSIGGTFAYVEFSTGSVVNVFKHGAVNITVDEEFDQEDISYDVTSKKVRIKNDSCNNELNVVPVYIRVALVSSWINEDGTVKAVNPDEFIEYILNLNDQSTTDWVMAADVSDGSWVLGNDGFYYFTGVVDVDCYTDFLLEGVKLKDNAIKPDAGHLEINVLADAVQADISKVNKAWKTPVDKDGNQIYKEN